MRRLLPAVFVAIHAIALAAPAPAVQPDEILPDPALERRAREISALLRCPVCQGESIDESDAGVARDLRLLVRERLAAGDSDQEVIGYIVARYGEFVLFDPPKSGANLILWIAGPAMLILGLAVMATLYRRGGRAAEGGAGDGLTDEESARLAAILERGETGGGDMSHGGTGGPRQ